MKVLGISASPRLRGNTEILLQQALAGAEAAGAAVELLRLSDYAIKACTECEACYTTGVCCLPDDYDHVLGRLLDVDRLIFATPVFFMTVSAQAKLLIDRGQGLWAKKYLLKQPLFEESRDRRGMVIAVGGSRSRKQFDGIRRTMKSYFDCLQLDYASSLFVNQVDEKGSVEKHPSALQEAFRLGRQLAGTGEPSSDHPAHVELF